MSIDQVELRGLIASYWMPHVVTCAAQLGIADAMGDRPENAAELAGKLGLDAEALARLLRAMASLGLASDEGEGQFALTRTGACLRADHPQSLKGMAMHVGTQLSPAFAALAECVSNGQPPEFVKHGPDGFAEFADKPEAAAIFNQSMVDNSRRIAGQAAEAYDFTGFSSIMDVGGGYGAVLATLLNAVPGATGSVLDLGHAKEGALALFEHEGVADRARFCEASFFDQFPESADCYVLKYILHDWNDAYAAEIVARVGEASAKSDGTVILIEKIMPDRFAAQADDAIAAQGDLTMMLWGGKERTESEFRELFSKGNLALTRIVPLPDKHFVIEARPAG